MSGKGDTRRPAAVPDATVAANWRRTFAKAVEDIEHTQERRAPCQCGYCKVKRGEA